VTDPWQILRDGGLPLATPRSGARPSAGSLAAAARAAIETTPRGRDAGALAAFVLAWHHHWPTAFADALARDAADVIAWAERQATDANRYLKLRRIALENLAQIL
jgi:hypothetical protein